MIRFFFLRVAYFTCAFLLLSLLWLIFEVPVAIRYWCEARWDFIRDLWVTSGEEL